MDTIVWRNFHACSPAKMLGKILPSFEEGLKNELSEFLSPKQESASGNSAIVTPCTVHAESLNIFKQ
jgi:hypothetical protein